ARFAARAASLVLVMRSECDSVEVGELHLGDRVAPDTAGNSHPALPGQPLRGSTRVSDEEEERRERRTPHAVRRRAPALPDRVVQLPRAPEVASREVARIPGWLAQTDRTDC